MAPTHFGFSESKPTKKKGKKTSAHAYPMSTGAGTGTAYQMGYQLNPTVSLDETTDGSNSLTYSASSSQAGESTDSSLENLNLLLQDQDIHFQIARERIHDTEPTSNFNRGNSINTATDSLGYSDDDDEEGDLTAYAYSINAATTPVGSQPSDSHGHDGGGVSKRNRHTTTMKSSHFKSPVSAATSDLSCTGSNGTPNTPPPRHARKVISHDTEVWYAKWWMCGFTDALNLNTKC